MREQVIEPGRVLLQRTRCRRTRHQLGHRSSPASNSPGRLPDYLEHDGDRNPARPLVRIGIADSGLAAFTGSEACGQYQVVQASSPCWSAAPRPRSASSVSSWPQRPPQRLTATSSNSSPRRAPPTFPKTISAPASARTGQGSLEHSPDDRHQRIPALVPDTSPVQLSHPHDDSQDHHLTTQIAQSGRHLQPIEVTTRARAWLPAGDESNSSGFPLLVTRTTTATCPSTTPAPATRAATISSAGLATGPSGG